MKLRSLAALEPFVTKDGSTIRELHRSDAQTLAEASLTVGQRTQRHHHRRTEEIYFVLEGRGELEVDDDRAEIGPGDGVLIPPGAWHEPRALEPIGFPPHVRAAVQQRGHLLRVAAVAPRDAGPGRRAIGAQLVRSRCAIDTELRAFLGYRRP